MPAFPELDEPLSDGSVRVRLAAERDIPEILIAYQDDPELHLRMGDERPPSGAELGRRRSGPPRTALRDAAITLTILGRDPMSAAGQVNVHRR